MDLIPESVVEQLKTDGFVILTVPSGVQETIQTTFQAARDFFSAGLDQKMANRLVDDWGYRPFGIEYSGSPERPDLVESFSASVRNWGASNCLRSDTARNLYRQMLNAISVLEPIAECLTIRLAETLTNSAMRNVLQGAFRNWSCLQINHTYFDMADERMINDLHEDGHLITVACSTGPGLELLTPSGEFLPVTTKFNEVVIMPGEIIWLLSGGYVRPLYHRVRSEAQSHKRLALLFFGDIDPRLCKAWVSNEVNANTDIGARVLTNGKRFGLDAFTSD
jgi:isopenicillin N synthase-like dioxygenase